jgi:hypothetical protein
MAIYRKFAFVAAVLIVSSATLLAADTKGWYDEGCTLMEFHFTRFPGQTAGEELRVQMPTGVYQVRPERLLGDWLGITRSVKGRRCDHSGNCEEAIKADIQAQRVAKRRISGRYMADFKGQHLEGQFTAKYRKISPAPLCE